MAIVEVFNTTNMQIVLADSSGNFGSVNPNSILAVDESVLAKECVASPVRKGWLKVKQGGKFVGVKGLKTEEKPAAKKTSTEPVTYFPEEQGITAKVITFDHGKAANDAIAKQAAEEAVVKSENETENLGQKLVRRGRKKKLISVDIQKGGPRRFRDMSSVKKQLPNVVEINGNMFAGVTDKAQMIVPSTIPGGAQLVDMEDMSWDQLTRLAKETNSLVDDLARDRKVFMYSNQGNAEREKFIGNTQDIGFLKQLEGGELNPKLLKAIRSKIKTLEGANVQQG